MKQITSVLSTVAAVAAIAFGGALLGAAPASVAAGDSCVPADAWTETIEHPAVTHEETVVVVDTPAYDEEVFDHWQRYSWTGGPHEPDSPPPFPSDDWQPNVQGDPHGVGVEGAYFRSNGNSGKGDWFYLEAVTTTVHHEAVTHEETVTVVDEPAWTETIEHEAVVCDPEDPKDPKDPEEPRQPEREREQRCLGGALVTEVFVDGQRVSSSTENGHPDCAQRTEDGEPFQEEGM